MRLQLSIPSYMSGGQVGDYRAFAFRKLNARGELGTLKSLGNERGNLGQVAGAYNKVNMGSSSSDFLCPELSHATANTNDRVRKSLLEESELTDQ